MSCTGLCRRLYVFGNVPARLERRGGRGAFRDQLAWLEMDGDYTPQQVAELHARGEIELIDVREPNEHEAGRIGGERHIALADLPAHADTLDRERPLVFYCRSGSRS